MLRRQPTRPRPAAVAQLAALLACAAADLIDLADREQLPPAGLLILDAYGQEIPNLRNENRPSQLPHPPAQSAPQQTCPRCQPSPSAGSQSPVSHLTAAG